MSKPIILIGNGGHSAVITEILQMMNYEIVGFTAPELQSNRYGLPYLGSDEVISHYHPNEIELVLAIGSIRVSNVRKRFFNQYKSTGFKFTSVIHPSCIISPTVNLGEGIQLMAGVIIQSNVKISDNSIINTGALIDHDCKIGSHVHVAPGCRLSGGVIVDSGCHIGTGATVIQGISVGEDTLVGAGSVVIRNVGPYKKIIGVPAKEV